MGALARTHRRADRARHQPRPVAFWLRLSKARARVYFNTAHLGSGAIEGMGKMKERE